MKIFTGHRRERFRYELLNMKEIPVCELTTILGGSLDFSLFTQIRSGGSIRIIERENINYLSDRIKLFYELWDGQQWKSFPLGIYLPASPRKIMDGDLIERDIDIYDKTIVLNQAMIDDTWIVPAGAVVTDAVRYCLEWAEGVHVKSSITESDQTLLSDMIWMPGTAIIRIINDLLEAINYFSIWADENGTFRAEPYTSPGRRTPVWHFENGKDSVHLQLINQDIDYFNVANVVILVTEAIGEGTSAMISKIYNDDAESPFSISNRGRMIVDFRENEEATSQEILDAKAQRILSEAMQVCENIEIQHPWLPISINDVITITEPVLDFDMAKFAVTKKTTPLQVGGLTRTTARRVIE